MPCVCLANTLAKWQSIKITKRSLGKQTLAVARLDVTQRAGTRMAEDQSVRVPHARTKIGQATPVVQDLASEIIAMKAAAQAPVRVAKSAGNAVIAVKTSTKASKKATKVVAGVVKEVAKTTAKSKTKAVKVAKPKLFRPRKVGQAQTTKAPAQPAVNLNRPAVRMTRADMINAEAKLGSALFGPIPEGHRREFFHDRNNIWIWHEDWQDGQQNPRQMTVRYEVRTSGVYKKISKGKYFRLEGEELENFRKATHAYLFMIKKYFYNRTSKTTKV